MPAVNLTAFSAGGVRAPCTLYLEVMDRARVSMKIL